MGIFMMILSFIATLAIVIGLYWVCKKFVFRKIKINKWIPLGISIVLFIIQIFLPILNETPIVKIILSIVVVLFFLWFMDIQQTGGLKKTEKKIVIKPKAKPNRVKNKNK
ncbi:hypothetical protein [Clostridium uliginosum]|uniref:Uncharacterized protein n=1 Tax=Clostridium uliginosum TaxID=119641 RepID=A0A1I1K6L7_9CLOT|nr:hypothetical protein [Clostridium uliginosum]SFC56627.1 hypothetical protein SAMN05421842_10593 [Clostridium uliginosum]